MKISSLKLFFLLIISVCVSHFMSAQNRHYFSVSPFLGMENLFMQDYHSGSTIGNGLFEGIAANYRFNQVLLSAEVKYSTELTFWDSPGYSILSINTLGGLRHEYKYWLFDIQLGLGYVDGYIPGKKGKGINALIKGGVKWCPFKYVALGIGGRYEIGNFNHSITFPSLSLEIGSIRDLVSNQSKQKRNVKKIRKRRR